MRGMRIEQSLKEFELTGIVAERFHELFDSVRGCVELILPYGSPWCAGIFGRILSYMAAGLAQALARSFAYS